MNKKVLEIKVLDEVSKMESSLVTIKCNLNTLNFLSTYSEQRLTKPSLLTKRKSTYYFIGIPIKINRQLENNILLIGNKKISINL
jgi:hypothetical protein